MQVFTARSYETFDIEYLCNELKQQVDANVKFGERTLGIAVCDSTIDYESVMKKLSEIYKFDIYGCTALAFIRIKSDEDISVSFMVITGGEELVGSMALSEPLTGKNADEAVADTYRLARERLGEEPKLILSLQPFSMEITPERILKSIDRAAGSRPVYGAVSSSDLATNISGVFVNGVFYRDRVLLNLLGGGIKPLFAVRNAPMSVPLNTAMITKAEGNVVYKVGDDTFLEYMAKNGLIVEPSFVMESFIATYTSNPVLSYKKGDQENTTKTCNIIHIDYETGAVAFTSEMHEGWEVVICILGREGVKSSSVECFEEMTEKILKNTTDTYKYSTLFSTSCGGRYLLMTGDTSVEGDFITGSPVFRNLASCGFYAMGEMCPISVDKNGIAVNRSHHSAVTLMAL